MAILEKFKFQNIFKIKFQSTKKKKKKKKLIRMLPSLFYKWGN